MCSVNGNITAKPYGFDNAGNITINETAGTPLEVDNSFMCSKDSNTYTINVSDSECSIVVNAPCYDYTQSNGSLDSTLLSGGIKCNFSSSPYGAGSNSLTITPT